MSIKFNVEQQNDYTYDFVIPNPIGLATQWVKQIRQSPEWLENWRPYWSIQWDCDQLAVEKPIKWKRTETMRKMKAIFTGVPALPKPAIFLYYRRKMCPVMYEWEKG